MVRRFDAFDTNGDGSISVAELEAKAGRKNRHHRRHGK
jgi:Ca2+-binding EF-hand superfamily protein